MPLSREKINHCRLRYIVLSVTPTRNIGWKVRERERERRRTTPTATPGGFFG